MIPPHFYKEFEKPQIKNFGHDLRKISIIFPKLRQKMKNKDFRIFQTAVRKYVGVFEKKLKWLFFLLLFTDLQKTIRKNFGQKLRKIFIIL